MSYAEHLFDWNAVPGKDDKRLLEHLEKCLKIGELAKAEVAKSDDGKTVTVSHEGTQVFLRLDEEKRVVLLESPDARAYEYLVKKEGDRLRVYVTDLLLLLRGLSDDDDAGFRRIAEAIVEASYSDPRKITAIRHSGDEDDSSKASAVLLELGDLVLSPLLNSAAPDPPEEYVWDVKTVTDIQVSNRLRISRLLEKMLGDKRPLQMPEPPPNVEETPPPRRVCDEAYLMMRELLSFEEAEEERFFNSVTFLGMTDKEKDTEISRARRTKRWTSLAEQL